MHRGSSKGDPEPPASPESLPLSASPESLVVVFELRRPGHSELRELQVRPGTSIREALRRMGYPPEGCAVLLGDQPMPLDERIRTPMRLVVLPAFSGG